MAKEQTNQQQKVYDCFGSEVVRLKNHFESFVVNRKKLAIEDGELVVIETGTEDTRAKVQSEKCNAGFENLRKQLALRYGTFDNALAHLQQNQVYADVSDIPDSPGAQAEWAAQQQARLQQLANRLGISVDELLSMTEANYNALINQQQQAASGTAGSAETGGSDNG